MSKKKKIILIIGITLIVMAVVGGISYFFISYNNDKKQTKIKIDNIIKNYEGFKSSIESFSAKRVVIYDEIFKESYFEDIPNKKQSWDKNIKEYEEIIKTIEDNAKKLKKDCTNIYSDKSVNNKCDAFKTLYEQSINYFVTDMELINKTIDDYNKWVIENNDSMYQQIEKYKTEYTEYIDYNKDGNYLGKE